MQIYMSKYIADGNSYKKRVFLPIVCDIALLILLPSALGFLTAANGGISSLFLQWIIALLLILFVIFNTFFLHHIGTIAHRDALVFCTDNNDSLYVVDAKYCAPSYKGFWGRGIHSARKFFKVLWETEQVIARIKTEGVLEEDMRTGKINTYALQISNVNKLQHVPAGKFVVCNVVRNNVKAGTQRYDISHHSEELFDLLKQRSISKEWETGIKKYTKQICISALLTVLCLAICVVSYPTVGLLPESVYFPCLFALSIPVIVLGTFILKRQKGE